MKRKITIEKLLEWAFREELCKVGAGGGFSLVSASAWDLVSGMAELGTLIDRSPNGYGVIPGFHADGEPHPDALLVGDAVRGLREIGFEIPKGWNPLSEFDDPHGLIAAEVERVAGRERIKGDRLTGRHMAALVTGAAILGRGPDWSIADDPGFRRVLIAGEPAWYIKRRQKDALGRFYEIETADGLDKRSRRPKKGAYRKFELKRPMGNEILSRLEWQIWQDALDFLHGRLAKQLSAYDLEPFAPRRFPWLAKRKNQENLRDIEIIDEI